MKYFQAEKIKIPDFKLFKMKRSVLIKWLINFSNEIIIKKNEKRIENYLIK